MMNIRKKQNSIAKIDLILMSVITLCGLTIALDSCRSKVEVAAPVVVVETEADYEFYYDTWEELFDQKQYDEALVYLKKAAAGDHIEALNDLAYQYSEGSVYKHDIKLAERYARRGAELGDMNCQRRLGMILKTEDRNQEALEWMVKSARQGQGSAAFMAAEMYEIGEGTKANLDLAIYWYKDAAKKTWYGDSDDAKEALKRLHVPLYDDDEYMELVQDQLRNCEGSAESLYKEGKYWKYDYEPEQLACLMKSAEMGYPFAQKELATIYSSNDAQMYGIHKEKLSDSLAVKAYDSFVELAKTGDVDAFYELGSMYYRGYSFLEKNIKLAEHCFRKGAEAGHDGCQLWLGNILRETDRKEEALRWFIKAGNQDQGWAAYQAGEMYEKGEGTSKNMDKAIKWYTVSAQSPYIYAIDARNALKRLGQPVPDNKLFSY